MRRKFCCMPELRHKNHKINSIFWWVNFPPKKIFFFLLILICRFMIIQIFMFHIKIGCALSCAYFFSPSRFFFILFYFPILKNVLIFLSIDFHTDDISKGYGKKRGKENKDPWKINRYTWYQIIREWRVALLYDFFCTM